MQWRKPQNRALVLEALHKTGREDLIGYGKHCLIRPGKGQSYGAQGGKDSRPAAAKGKDGTTPRGKKGSGDPRKERFDGRHTVEKKSAHSTPKRKAGWAKPAVKKGTKGRKKR